MEIKEILNTYTDLIPTLDKYRIKLEGLIYELLDNNKIAYHVIESRIKTLDSFKEKVQASSRSYINPISEITDLVGLRIILYYLEDTEKVREMVEKEFKPISDLSSNKIDDLKPNEFGYLSIHSIIEIDSKRGRLSEWKKYKGLRAEIQIRTVLQHSWASISHILLYKKESDVPQQLKRKLNRLAGLLELADEQFQELKLEQAKTTSIIAESIAHKNYNIDINSVSVHNFFTSSIFIKKVNSILKKFNRYEVEMSYDETDFSQIVTISKAMGFTHLIDLNNILSNELHLMESFFKLFYANDEDKDFSSVMGSSIHFLAVFLAALYLKNNEKPKLKLWSKDYWNEIKKAINKIS